MNQIILIQRYLPSSIFWPNMVNDNKIIGLTVEEVLKKYQGFEGDLIACFPIQENDPELNEIIIGVRPAILQFVIDIKN